MSQKPLTAIIVGAGHRAAAVYAAYALKAPDRLKIVGVADPIAHRRESTAKTYGLRPDQCWESAAALAAKGKIADAIINGTMDAEHVPTTLPLLEVGYDVLLEKPFAVSEAEVKRLADAVKKSGRKVMICHVLRYTPFYGAIHKRVASGELGELVNLQFTEHVSYHHGAAAFIRGKWGSEKACGSPILLAKCCHDIDLLMWMKRGVKPRRISSFGSVGYFKADRAPKGAGTLCLADCPIERDCPFSAAKHYLEMDLWGTYAWSNLEHVENPTRAQKEALLCDPKNPYARCVWRSDNDVCDRQSVMIEFEDDSTATFNLVMGVAHPMRKIHLLGTKGEIRGMFEEGRFTVEKPDARPKHEFSEELVDTQVNVVSDQDFGGHGGGDGRLIADFVNLVRGEPVSPACTRIEDSVNGHLAVFLAEKARKTSAILPFA
jgi:predicted dehydrogenase